MALTNADRAEIIAKFARAENDTGSPEVQVALLTAQINDYKVTSKSTNTTTIAVAVLSVWLTNVVSFLITLKVKTLLVTAT